MHPDNFIEFKRERELGEILSDTFAFIRYNYKKLFQVILRLVGPVLLVLLIAVAGNVYLMFGKDFGFFALLEQASQGSEPAMSRFFGTMGIAALAVILLSAFYYAILFASINFTIKSYIDNQGEIDIDEVSANVRESWVRFLGLALLAGLIVFVGLMFCVIPGIYFYVPLSLVFAIMVFYDLNIGESISYSFKLIKQNWWISFFTLLIMGLIYYLSSGIFQLPATIYSLFKTMTFSKEISATANPMDVFDWIYMLLTLIAYVAKYVIYVVMVICTTFIFFNLNEKKNQTGAFETIENLGD